MKRKRTSKKEELKRRFLELRTELYEEGFWITPESLLLHVEDMGDKEVLWLFEEFFLLRAYDLSNDMRKTPEETRNEALNRVEKHPFYQPLFNELIKRELYVSEDTYWILTGEAIEK